MIDVGLVNQAEQSLSRTEGGIFRWGGSYLQALENVISFGSSTHNDRYTGHVHHHIFKYN